jgi:hypothetical protein
MKKKKYFNVDCDRTHRKNETLKQVQFYPANLFLNVDLSRTMIFSNLHYSK